MKHWILGIALAAMLPAVLPTVEAAPANTAKTAAQKKMAKKKMAKKPAMKMIAVRICPMSNTPVDGEGAASRVVKNYKAFFC